MHCRCKRLRCRVLKAPWDAHFIILWVVRTHLRHCRRSVLRVKLAIYTYIVLSDSLYVSGHLITFVACSFFVSVDSADTFYRLFSHFISINTGLMNFLCSFCRQQWTAPYQMQSAQTQAKPEAAHTLHHPTIALAWEEVPRETVSEHCRARWILVVATPHRDTGENLVSESSGEGETTARGWIGENKNGRTGSRGAWSCATLYGLLSSRSHGQRHAHGLRACHAAPTYSGLKKKSWSAVKTHLDARAFACRSRQLLLCIIITLIVNTSDTDRY